MPLEASSQDYNQSVHRTVNVSDENQFWSSTGSGTAQANEWLTYKIPMAEIQKGVNGYAVITKFKLKVFDPNLMQVVDHKYAPDKV